MLRQSAVSAKAHLDGGIEGYQLRRIASIFVSNIERITRADISRHYDWH